MSLIDTERDDEAVLRAEDEAIEAADKEPEAEGVELTGIPKLIEDVFSGTAPAVHRETEG